MQDREGIEKRREVEEKRWFNNFARKKPNG